MLLDVSFSNLYVANIGTTIENLLNLSNTIIFHTHNINFDNISRIVTLLNIWPTDSQMSNAVNTVFFAAYTNDTYFETVRAVYSALPYLYALDFLHMFYVKQAMYQMCISSYLESTSAILKPVVISLQLDLFFSMFTTKWSYALFIFGITYFFTNIMKFRYQYGFNFYFTYFKTLADLGEQEYGSYDDYKFFVFFLVQMLMWYCWVFFIGYTFVLQSESQLVLLTLSVMITILTIPVRLLWDFGLAFGMYVRGASSSSNLVVEAFFDIIGVIIIFTRFVVQNIRFLLVFVAFFELFEWSSSTAEIGYILELATSVNGNMDIYTAIESQTLFVYLLNIIKISFIYLYHLLHLIIVSFMQIGVYLVVSFWLFFFLYTSFSKITLDSYFSVKRN